MGELNVMNEKGFSMLEILIAISIFAVGLLALAALQTTTLKTNTFSRDMTQALRSYNQDKVEELLSLGFYDTTLDVGSYLDAPQNGYTTSWTVTSATSREKTISVTTDWSDLMGSHTVTTGFIKLLF